MFQVHPFDPVVCMFICLRLLFWSELGEVVGVSMRATISLVLVQPQLGAVDDEVPGPVLSFLRGQGANLRHLGVNPTNKYIRS